MHVSGARFQLTSFRLIRLAGFPGPRSSSVASESRLAVNRVVIESVARRETFSGYPPSDCWHRGNEATRLTASAAADDRRPRAAAAGPSDDALFATGLYAICTDAPGARSSAPGIVNRVPF